MGILQILKIKPWMIKFKIDNQIYFIKQSDDAYECAKYLYKYIPLDDNGHYRTECLKGSCGDLNVSDFVTRKQGQTYRNMDLRKFWAALAWYNFGEAVGMDAEQIGFFKHERQRIMYEEKIEKLEKELSIARLNLFVLEHLDKYQI